jgi:hypothetical protein
MTHLAAPPPAIQSIGIPITLCLLLISLGGCAEPFIVMSGKSLAGTVSDPPVDWTEFNVTEIVQLETRPDDPYSVNIWMAAIGPDIYVATGDDDTNWSSHLNDDPDVRLRIGTTVYELEARRVLDTREKRAVASIYVEKYGLDADDNWVIDGQVFRLDRR